SGTSSSISATSPHSWGSNATSSSNLFPPLSLSTSRLSSDTSLQLQPGRAPRLHRCGRGCTAPAGHGDTGRGHTPGDSRTMDTAGHGGQTKGTATHGSHLLPEGTPTPLIPALILMETMRLIIRPLALGARPTLISTAPTAWFSTISAVSLLTLLIVFSLTILEVAVAIIQACVFVLLLSLYLEENI
uniref:ATP synthase F(0) complex subunit a n=1 Tax=Zonotrichia albicollis TaxID=44394 RepID=A0A8D2MS44_ZONAL